MSHYENVPFQVPDGWCWTSLNNTCTIFGRIGFRGYTKDDLVDSTGAITLSPSNIVDGVMNYEKCTYISWEKYEESPEIQIQNHDILLVKTGSSYGKCSYVESLPKEATINPQFVVLKFIGCNPKFLTYCLQSNYARKKYEEFVLGTAIPTFTQVALGAMGIPMPPIEEQERIVAEVERLLLLIDSLDESANELGIVIFAAKSKILDLAIHGKLVPQDPNDESASELLKRINPKAAASCDNPHYEQVPFEIPSNWVWATLGDITNYGKCSTVPVDDIDEESWVLELEDIEKDSGKVIKLWTKSDREIKGIRHSFSKSYVLYWGSTHILTFLHNKEFRSRYSLAKCSISYISSCI